MIRSDEEYTSQEETQVKDKDNNLVDMKMM